MAKKEKEVSALSAVIAYFVMNTAVNAMLKINGDILADGTIAEDVLCLLYPSGQTIINFINNFVNNGVCPALQ